MLYRNLSPLSLALLLFAPGAASAQEYVHEGGVRYQVDTNGDRYVVREGYISLRFAPGFGLEDHEALQGAEVLRSNRLGIVDLRLPAGSDSVEVVRQLEASGVVEFACVDTIGTWFGNPDDPEFGAQWSLLNTVNPGADVGALAAWNVTTGDPSIVMAVLDSGTEVTHSDLAPNLWFNPGEIVNGLDDDGNGRPDDVHGWDFEGNDPDLSSQVGHGTQTAGVMAARTNNGVGVAALAGGYGASKGCSLMALKVGTQGPIASIVDDAILYAVDEGARVLNCSFGIGNSAAVDSAINMAHAAGVVIVVASGNSGGAVAYPANHPTTIAVGATVDTDSVWPSSSRGPELDLVAPGVLIRTTSFFNGYSTATGTSFSSPLVAGAAALLLSVDPGLDADEVRDALRASALDLGPPGHNNPSGYGRLDAAALLAPYECGGTNYCSSTPTSSGNPGIISYSGSTSVATNDLVLEAEGLPLGPTPGLFYYGTAATDLPFGNGQRCVGGTVQRLDVIPTQVGGTVSYAVDLTNPPQASGQISADETWYFQFWFRDPLAGGAFFNLTDGLELTFCP